jgi:hypothetical protein
MTGVVPAAALRARKLLASSEGTVPQHSGAVYGPAINS